MKAARTLWKKEQSCWDASKLVFIDETGLNTKMTRLYGRALKAERCHSAVPAGHWQSFTFLAALRIESIGAPFLIEGALDGDVLTVYLQEILCPELREGDTVILDNLPTHKIKNLQKLIAAQGATVRYLPAYSPDLNPIEQAFSKLKANLRQAAARTYDQLLAALKPALASFSPNDCLHFFQHASYATN